MEELFEKILGGYQAFRKKYATGDESVMHQLATKGQKPEIMVIACCDSRVDPAIILQCDPGDLFVMRNIANIVPPYEEAKGQAILAALEFAVCYLKVKHIIILGHSDCSGIQALLHHDELKQNDFISDWVSFAGSHKLDETKDDDSYAKQALSLSYDNCLSFPWIKSEVSENKLAIHRWFFDIDSGEVLTYLPKDKRYQPLLENGPG